MSVSHSRRALRGSVWPIGAVLDLYYGSRPRREQQTADRPLPTTIEVAIEDNVTEGTPPSGNSDAAQQTEVKSVAKQDNSAESVDATRSSGNPIAAEQTEVKSAVDPSETTS
jgi:hypothetical protein